MRTRAAHVLGATLLTGGLVVFIAACGSGEGPIGVGAIGGRESPGSAFENPRRQRGPTGSTPAPAPTPIPSGTGTSQPPPPDSGPIGPIDSGSPTSLAAVCTGTFDCSGILVSLSNADGRCTFLVNGQLFVLNADNTVSTGTGAAAGAWAGNTSGFTVTANGNSTVCTPGAPSGGP